jgi:outer membrane protein assembly factor BamA
MFDTQRRLYDLGIFAKVDTAIQNPEGDTYRKFVLYDMEEAREYSLGVGLGAEIARIGGCSNCLDAPAGEAGFAPRVLLDISRMNLWGIGHTISFRNRYSSLQRRSLLNYSAPRFRNHEGLNLSFTGLYDDSRDVRTFTSKRLEGSAQLSQRWSKATTFFYRYTYRRVAVDEETLKITPLLIPLYSQPVGLGLLGWAVIQDRRDDPLDTQKGIYNTIDLGAADKLFGSQKNFVRFLGRNATYHRLSQKYVLARNTSFGIMQPYRYTGTALDAIPLPERFFGGGGTSHRGFPENQAGPRDPTTGFPVGGTALLFNQVELRFPLLGENIAGVLFHDAGNIYSTVGDITFRPTQRTVRDFNYMVHAVGFGLRYRTPIGPVRVDLAYSINPPQFYGFKGTYEELINAGVNPCEQPGRCVVQSVNHFQFFFSLGQTF